MTACAAASSSGNGPILDVGEFAEFWSGGGNITLVAICPGNKLPTVTYDHTEADVGARDFAEVHQEAKANVYYTVNQAHGPIAKKPAKSDMAFSRAVWADLDPHEAEERKPDGWNWERQRLKALAGELAADPDFPPTVIIDSGNGIQPIWHLAEDYPLDGPSGEATRRIEAIGRGIEKALGGTENTSNVDRILRLPGTKNFPNKKKKDKGRGITEAKVLFWSGRAYSFNQLEALQNRLNARSGSSFVPRQASGGQQPSDRKQLSGGQQPCGTENKHIAEVQEELVKSWATIRVTDYAHLSADLREKFQDALMLHPKLLRRWEGDVEGLDDPSRSGLAMALCGCLKVAGFDLLDTARILLVYKDGDIGDAKKYPKPKGQARAIARAWVRSAPEHGALEQSDHVNQAGIEAARRVLAHALPDVPGLVDELLAVCHHQNGATDVAFARSCKVWAEEARIGVNILKSLRKTALQAADSACKAAERAKRAAGRRSIKVDPGNLAQAVADAEAALADGDPPRIFRLGDQPVEVVAREDTLHLNDTTDRADDVRLSAGTTTLPMSVNLMRAVLSELAVFETATEVIPPPQDVAAVLVERGPGLRIPDLTGVLSAPALRSDGSIQFSRGFDPITRAYAVNCFKAMDGSIPTTPTREDAEAAMNFLLAPFAEMPWSPAESQATHAAHILTLLTRHMVALVPLFAYLAPTPGSGKTLAAEAPSRIVNGRGPTLMPSISGRDTDEEMRKRLTALLAASRSDIVFDNVARGAHFGGGPLDALLTSPTWSDRLLGATTTVSLPNRTTIAVTGNNIKLGGDLGRRTVFSYLDPGCADPENRQFTINDLRGYLHQHRERLLAAALTVMRAHLQHNQPLTGGCQQADTIGSFESWSRLVAAAVEWVGLANPLETQKWGRDAADISAEDAQGLETFLIAVHEAFGRRPFTAADVLERATFHFEEGDEKRVTEALSGALRNLMPDPVTSQASAKLGRLMTKEVNRTTPGGWSLRLAGSHAGTRRYSVEPPGSVEPSGRIEPTGGRGPQADLITDHIDIDNSRYLKRLE